MSTYFSKEFITGFIELYRQNPCLWKVKNKDYTNKSMKNAAYDKLVAYCKKDYTHANREFVTKKIQSLRGSFRKELQKVKNSLKPGANVKTVYKPTLWYYDLLKFTADQEQATENISNSNDDETRGFFNFNEIRRNEKYVENEEYVDASESIKRKFMTSDSNMSRRKRKKHDASYTKILKTCADALKETSEISEFDAVGVNVSKKLQRMNSIQALHAESLINAVLKKGLLGTLTDNTEIRT